jgi:hypothetical protein
MAILLSDLKGYGVATEADDDSTEQIGGAIDTQKKKVFVDYAGNLQLISSAAGDTVPTVTITYRNAAGSKLTEAKTLNGQSPVAYAATVERLLKAVKSGSTTGDVAVEASVAERTGTCQASGNGNVAIALDAGASAVNDAYLGLICRITAGTGNGQIREVYGYDGTTKIAIINHPWGTNPDGTSEFRLSKGFFFEKSPAEVLQVRRIFFDAGANPGGGAEKKVYDCICLKNAHASLALTSAVVKEFADPSTLIAFALATAVNDNGTNGAGNTRLVAPAGLTFNSADKNVPGGQLAAGDYIKVWLELTLAGGAAALKSSYTPYLQGNTVA